MGDDAGERSSGIEGVGLEVDTDTGRDDEGGVEGGEGRDEGGAETSDDSGRGSSEEGLTRSVDDEGMGGAGAVLGSGSESGDVKARGAHGNGGVRSRSSRGGRPASTRGEDRGNVGGGNGLSSYADAVGGGAGGGGGGGGGGSGGLSGLTLDGVGVASNFTRHSGAGPKEKLGHGVDAAKVASILSQLYLPKTSTWAAAKVNRLIVSRNAPENKYLTARKMDLETLPQSDLAVTFDSCAVIGNGGVLVHDEYGDAIDRHDAVFRFNDGPTQTFEKLVGSKTTFRIINNSWSRAWLRKRARGTTEEHLLLFGIGAAKAYEALVKRYPDVKVWFMAPEFAGVARGMYKKAYLLMNEAGIVEVKGRNSPPTGVEGLFFALAVCKQVHLYGFGISADPTVPYHYHDKVKGVEAAHSFGFQAIFLKMLAQSGHFDICVPGLAVPGCRMEDGNDEGRR
jgi:hypothetical protein